MSKIGTYFRQSLRRELLLSSFVSIAIGIAIAVILFFLLFTLTDSVLYGDTYTKRMSRHQADKIQEYVTSNEINLDSLYKMDEWLYTHSNKVYFYFYTDKGIVYEPWENSIAWYEDEEQYEYHANHEGNYGITLSDGTEVAMYLAYYPGDGFYVMCIVIAIILGSLGFAFVFIWLINKKLKYVETIHSELEILANGQLERAVSVHGEDELAILAKSINHMKDTIISKQKAEDAARRANSELVTAMSHDLRSPLTALIGYLEIINRRKYQTEEQAAYFTDHSLQKAFQIKEMSDKLFEYFLVYSKDWNDVDQETYLPELLVGDMINDMLYSLESAGFQVTINPKQLLGTVSVNTDLIKRVFDNMYSNILKYADPAEPVRVQYNQTGHEIVVLITNRIANRVEKKESTCIGLKTCEKIMEYHQGSFEYEIRDSFYTYRLKLPIQSG